MTHPAGVTPTPFHMRKYHGGERLVQLSDEVPGVRRNISKDERRTAWEKAYPTVPFGTVPPVTSSRKTPILHRIMDSTPERILNQLTLQEESLSPIDRAMSRIGMPTPSALPTMDKLGIQIPQIPTKTQEANEGLKKTGTDTPTLDRLNQGSLWNRILGGIGSAADIQSEANLRTGPAMLDYGMRPIEAATQYTRVPLEPVYAENVKNVKMLTPLPTENQESNALLRAIRGSNLAKAESMTMGGEIDIAGIYQAHRDPTINVGTGWPTGQNWWDKFTDAWKRERREPAAAQIVAGVAGIENFVPLAGAAKLGSTGIRGASAGARTFAKGVSAGVGPAQEVARRAAMEKKLNLVHIAPYIDRHLPFMSDLLSDADKIQLDKIGEEFSNKMRGNPGARAVAEREFRASWEEIMAKYAPKPTPATSADAIVNALATSRRGSTPFGPRVAQQAELVSDVPPVVGRASDEISNRPMGTTTNRNINLIAEDIKSGSGVGPPYQEAARADAARRAAMEKKLGLVNISPAGRAADEPVEQVLSGTAQIAENIKSGSSELAKQARASRIAEDVIGDGIENLDEVPLAPPEIAVNAVAKLIDLIGSAESVTIRTKAMRREQLGERSSKIAENLANEDLSWAEKYSYDPLTGKYNVAENDVIASKLAAEELHSLRMMFHNSDLRPLEKLNTNNALNALIHGERLQEGQLKLLKNIYGSELSEAVLKQRSGASKAWATVMDIVNFPRALRASYDMSAPLRQGVILSLSAPKQYFASMGSMIKSFGKESVAIDVDDMIRADPRFPEFQEAGLFHAELDDIAGFSTREEAYMSRFARKIPGIRASERSYITFLNKLRHDTMTKYVQNWDEAGKVITEGDMHDLANFINLATGRGNMPTGGRLEALTPVMNAAFFSPRLQLSRFQLPLALLTSTPEVRKIIAMALTKYVATGTGVLFMLSNLPDVDVETNPESTDFGKIRIGNQRFEFWASYQPIARLIAQFRSGQMKISETGERRPKDRYETVLNFLRQKLAPVPGAAVDIWQGETVIGQEVGDPKRYFGKEVPESLVPAQFAYENLAPLFISDVIEAIDVEGPKGAVLTPFAFFGAGMQTYDNIYDMARKKYGKEYEDLPKNYQEIIRREVYGPETRKSETRRQEELWKFFPKSATPENKAAFHAKMDQKYGKQRRFQPDDPVPSSFGREGGTGYTGPVPGP